MTYRIVVALVLVVVTTASSVAQPDPQPGVGRFGAIAPAANQNNATGVLVVLNTYAPKDAVTYDVVIFVEAKKKADGAEWTFVKAAEGSPQKHRSANGRLIGVSRITGKQAAAMIFLPHSAFDLDKGEYHLRFIATFYVQGGGGLQEVKALKKEVGDFPIKIVRPRELEIRVFGAEVPPVSIQDYQPKDDQPKDNR